MTASRLAYFAIRLALTLVYVGALVLAVGPVGEKPVAWSIFLLTLVYAMWMLLLWLHERYPPPKSNS
jgi:hypothetical protein